MTDKQIIIYKKECYNEPHCSLNQVLEQLNAYKMEADEGKEINAELKAELTRANCQIADDEILQCDMREAIEELKAENEELKKKCNIYTCGICGNKEDCNKLYKTLTEIKEIAEKYTKLYYADFKNALILIIQKISEVSNDMEND